MNEVKEAKGSNPYRLIANYLEVLKPRETILLTFIGICAAIVAASGSPSLNQLFLALAAILLGSGGVNGLTNYLDREVDARMQRTNHRTLPSKRIDPPEKILPLAIGLVAIGLGLAWWLHPLCFFVGLIGTLAATTWRKKMTCVFPQGTIAGCSPVLIGWLAFEPRFSLKLLFICILIGVWIPLHVWSVMIAHREDYLGAGISYFPLSWEVKDAVKVLLGLSCLLYAASIALYFVADLALLYLVVANLLGIVMIYATARLVTSSTSQDAWKVYKLSAFPYLGLIFLTMCLDLWLL
jgi:protoheme IX farnesyltransferase